MHPDSEQQSLSVLMTLKSYQSSSLMTCLDERLTMVSRLLSWQPRADDVDTLEPRLSYWKNTCSRHAEKTDMVKVDPWNGTSATYLEKIVTLRAELQYHAKIAVTESHALLCWIVRHTAWALQRSHPSRGGATPYFKKHGAAWHGTVLEFGGHVQALNPEKDVDTQDSRETCLDLKTVGLKSDNTLLQ